MYQQNSCISEWLGFCKDSHVFHNLSQLVVDHIDNLIPHLTSSATLLTR